ncbi:putative ribonuclease H protein At1g65750 family [Senna tora]|uniref:Putative ribonuclease H protein At1g65750 family n=1 Tax=Senna tora TaxID=362788 RepID=A0A834SUD4_9FABA|nr:putative ribonuclease H protein At1g65750 family [Senna tora]
MNLTPGLFCDVPTSFWKSVWKLPILSRFKVMFWRACLGIIPRIDELERRGMGTARFDFSSWTYHNSLLEWMTVEWDRWGREKQCVFVMAIYFIWEARNQRKFANEVVNLNGVWAKVERQWDEACVADNGAHLDVEIPSELKWEKPKAPYLKLNVDEAVRSSGEGALGGLFRDREGVVHGAFMASAPALNDNTLVEALAIKKGVEVARQMGVLDLVVESDSRLMIDMLNSNYKICKAARHVTGEQIWQDCLPICITDTKDFH